MSDYFRADNEYRFPTLEKFRRSVLQPMMYGMTEADCLDGIKTACEFFNMPVPEFISDLTERHNGHTMFVSIDPTSYLDDKICYNLEELKILGITNKYAFTLVMTHECGHRYVQNYQFSGLNGGSWEEELCCDFFMGVRAGLESFPRSVVDSLRNGLERYGGTDSHPSGSLRSHIIDHGYRLGRFDESNKSKSTIFGYLEFYMAWLQNNSERVRQEQSLYGLY